MNPLFKNKLESAKRRHSKSRSHARIFIPENFGWTLNPFFQTGLWMLALVWGAVVSLLSDKIMQFSLPALGVDQSPNWYTLGFLLFSFVLALFFAMSQWVARAQDSIVVDSMITMPPADFWMYYGHEYTRISALAENSIVELLGSSDKHPEALEQKFNEDVRRILNAVINLVKKWDSSNLRGSHVVYRANVMMVWRFGELRSADDPLVDELEELADKFVLKPSLSHYSGFVGLRSNVFTTTTATDEPDIDHDCKPIAFPFTDLLNSLGQQAINANLLGAPDAVARNDTSYVHDVCDIVKHYREHAATSDRRILQNLRDYYSDTSIAHSILSIPITPIDEDQPRWVLNVYRNQGGLLFDGEKVVSFAEIIKPYTSAFARMMLAFEMYQDDYCANVAITRVVPTRVAPTEEVDV